MQRSRRLILFLAVMALSACEGTTFQSSVPTYPVRVVIDTRMGVFVHFLPTEFNAHVTVNRTGYWFNEQFALPVSAMDAWGYGGVVVFVGMNGYDAYDLACPYCAQRGGCHACAIDGIFAVCTECGEHYDLASGTAAPQKGLARETLRRLAIINSDGKLTVTQR